MTSTHQEAALGTARSTPSGFTTRAIELGLLGLPAYGILAGLGTLSAQPDQLRDPEAWAQFVSSPSYLAAHLLSNLAAVALLLLGMFAVAAYLNRGRAARLAVTGMVVSVVGQVLLMVPGVISTFVTPAVGATYLGGHPDIMSLQFPPALAITFVLGLLAAVAGGLIIGVAVWRSETLPRWAGAGWAAAAVTFYLLGAALGMATTGASLPTQPVGGLLMGISGAAMAWAAYRRRSAGQPGSSPVSKPTGR